MGLRDELDDEVKRIFADQWSSRKGLKVPDNEDLGLGNDAVEIEAAVLYADLTDSTGLVESSKPHFAAEVYKSYLRCAARIVSAEGGTITSFDGDRIMAVYIGDSKCTAATRTALKINFAVKKIINPALRVQYPGTTYEVKQVVGIDTSSLWVVRGGIRGSNDLLWIGNAANIAAKLCSLSADHPSWITKAVYDVIGKTAKFGKEGQNMWEQRKWTGYKDRIIYRSNWWWAVK